MLEGTVFHEARPTYHLLALNDIVITRSGFSRIITMRIMVNGKFLDDFAENQDIRAAYLEKYQTLCALRREMDSLNMDEGEKLRRMETLRYQIEEITKANGDMNPDTLRDGQVLNIPARQ